MGRLRKLRPIRGLRRSQVSLSSNSLSSKLAFRQPTWTASCRCRAVATNPQNSWKARRIRFQRFQYPRIVRGSSPAEFGQHRRPMETCFSRGHVASMESVTYTARNTRFPANLDSSGLSLSVHSVEESILRVCKVKFAESDADRVQLFFWCERQRQRSVRGQRHNGRTLERSAGPHPRQGLRSDYYKPSHKCLRRMMAQAS